MKQWRGQSGEGKRSRGEKEEGEEESANDMQSWNEKAGERQEEVEMR